MMITEKQIILRILVGALLGGVIGFERERHDQPAGLRTHIILVIGATLAMILSVNLGHLYARESSPFDPARIAAQVISGIGFLGAGAILRYGYNVKGLTTATSLWTMAIVGMSVGAGYYLVAVVATALMLGVLTLLNMIENRFLRASISRLIIIEAEYRKGLVRTIRESIAQHSDKQMNFNAQRNVKNNRMQITTLARFTNDEPIEMLIDSLYEIDEIDSVKIQ
ncbi:MAG TPA: MgtC/SapB family protein [Brevefilum sp.]|nr:MgtC/SapB family protein [Brevefilum sp.]HOR19301.1 MgtC/SapB family protein [Brevefilum sp.]HPL69906.1 MgtC/SapB family protein [Brevefilum sp.]